MRVILGIGIAVVLAALAFFLFIYSGRWDVAAEQPDPAPMRWVMETAVRQSVRAHAKGVESPPVGDPVMVEEGGRLYRELCEVCHGGPGVEPGPIGKGLNPRPADLARSVRNWSSSELFWITKHGLKSTGMPAFAESRVDAELWSVVAFINQMPSLQPDRYQEMTRPPQPAPAAEPEAAPPADGQPQEVVPPSEEEPAPGPAPDQAAPGETAPPPPSPDQPPPPEGQAPMPLTPRQGQ